MTDLDEVTRLRPDVADPTPEWLAANRSALLEHAAAGTPLRRRNSHRSSLIALAAGIAVLAVIALVVPASSTLTASQQHDQYVYVKQGYSDVDGGQLSISEGWYRIDSGTVNKPPRTGPPCTGIVITSSPGDRWRTAVAPSGSLSAKPCAALDPHAVRELTSPGRDAPGIIGWSYQQLTTLPTDPAQLRAKLYEMAREITAHKPKDPVDSQDYANTPDAEVFTLIWATLLKALVPPDLVPAFYHVLPTIPGVAAIQNVKDAAGRPGIGFTRPPDHQPAWQTTAIFDPTGSRFLGTTDLDNGDTGLPEMLVVLSSGLVDHIGDRL